MPQDSFLIDAAKALVGELNKIVDSTLPEEIAEIVKIHSAGAATAAVASGWVPGAGGVAAAAISAGFIWSMYGRINGKIGLSISDNILKTLASGVATNLAAYFAAGFVVSTALSFLPGIGSIGASVVVGTTGYALTLASGYVYLKVLTQIFASGRDPSTMTADALKQAATQVARASEIGAVIDEAKSSYKNSR